MDQRVKLIFDRNPKQEEVYQIIGSNRYFKQKDNALAAMEGNAGDLKTHKREEYYASTPEGKKKTTPPKKTSKKAPAKVVIPEGEPNKTWKVAEIKAYMKREGIAFVTRDKEADLLEKIANHKNAAV